jgi:hypothetical protein
MSSIDVMSNDGTILGFVGRHGQRAVHIILPPGIVAHAIACMAIENDPVTRAAAILSATVQPLRAMLRKESMVMRHLLVSALRSRERRRVFLELRCIEVSVRQMIGWVKIEDVGDTESSSRSTWTPSRLRGSGAGRRVPRERLSQAGCRGPADPIMEENERVIMNGGRPASGGTLLLGITKGVALDRLVHLRSQRPDRASAQAGGIRESAGNALRHEGRKGNGPFF